MLLKTAWNAVEQFLRILCELGETTKEIFEPHFGRHLDLALKYREGTKKEKSKKNKS